MFMMKSCREAIRFELFQASMVVLPLRRLYQFRLGAEEFEFALLGLANPANRCMPGVQRCGPSWP